MDKDMDFDNAQDVMENDCLISYDNVEDLKDKNSLK